MATRGKRGKTLRGQMCILRGWSGSLGGYGVHKREHPQCYRHSGLHEATKFHVQPLQKGKKAVHEFHSATSASSSIEACPDRPTDGVGMNMHIVQFICIRVFSLPRRDLNMCESGFALISSLSPLGRSTEGKAIHGVFPQLNVAIEAGRKLIGVPVVFHQCIIYTYTSTHALYARMSSLYIRESSRINLYSLRFLGFRLTR